MNKEVKGKVGGLRLDLDFNQWLPSSRHIHVELIS